MNGTCEGVAPHMRTVVESPGVSLFCFSVYTADTGSEKPSHELELLQMQHGNAWNVFSCTEWAIYSDVVAIVEEERTQWQHLGDRFQEMMVQWNNFQRGVTAGCLAVALIGGGLVACAAAIAATAVAAAGAGIALAAEIVGGAALKNLGRLRKVAAKQLSDAREAARVNGTHVEGAGVQVEVLTGLKAWADVEVELGKDGQDLADIALAANQKFSTEDWTTLIKMPDHFAIFLQVHEADVEFLRSVSDEIQSSADAFEETSKSARGFSRAWSRAPADAEASKKSRKSEKSRRSERYQPPEQSCSRPSVCDKS